VRTALTQQKKSEEEKKEGKERTRTGEEWHLNNGKLRAGGGVKSSVWRMGDSKEGWREPNGSARGPFCKGAETGGFGRGV